MRQNFISVFLTLYAALCLVSMATMSIGIGFLLLAIFALFLTDLRTHSHGLYLWVAGHTLRRRFFWASLALAAACFVSLVGARFFGVEYGGKGPQVEWGRDLAKLYYLALPFLVGYVLSICSHSVKSRVFFVWLMSSAALFALAPIQHVWGWPRPNPIPGYPGFYHVHLFLGHHLSLASIFIFPFFIWLDLALSARLYQIEWKNRLGRAFYFMVWIVVALGLFSFWGAFSRALWISIPLGLLFYIFLRYDFKKFSILGASVGVVVFLASLHPVIRTRVGDAYGWITRAELWRVNFEFFKERPLIGVGWHHNLQLSAAYFESKGILEKSFVGHAHNLYLEILASTGLFGILSFAAWLYFAARLIQKLPKFRLALWGAGVVFLLNGLTQVNFWESKVLHQLMWVMAWVLAYQEVAPSPSVWFEKCEKLS
jgi:O-antigen ligase